MYLLIMHVGGTNICGLLYVKGACRFQKAPYIQECGDQAPLSRYPFYVEGMWPGMIRNLHREWKYQWVGVFFILDGQRISFIMIDMDPHCWMM